MGCKKPKQKNSPPFSKTPNNTEEPAHAQKNPTSHERPNHEAKMAWRFWRMDTGGKCKCSLEALHRHVERILFYEERTRKQIEELPHCHPLSTKKLTKVGKERLDKLNLEIETVYQLDFHTPKRLWGVWEQNVFNVIWLDLEHSLYE